MTLKGVLVLAALLVLVIFTAQNYAVVEVEFLMWSFTTSRAILLFSTLCIGVAIGWVTGARRRPPDKPDGEE